MSNGEMLKDIKKLIESGEDFSVKQYRILTLSGMVELGDSLKAVIGEIDKVNSAAQTRICPEVKQAVIDIGKLETKSNRNDAYVGIGTVFGTIAGILFGSK